MLVFMVLLVCSVETGECKKVPNHDFDGGVTECVIQGQQFGAKYVNEHPKWVVKRYMCVIGNMQPGMDT